MTSNPVAVTHVLCPVDFSAISQHALDHASAIAYRNGATVTMLHVFATLPTMDLPPLVLSDEDRERLIRDMRQMAARVPARVPLDFRVSEAGYVHDEILAQLDQTHADLLVLGTHGRSGFQRLFLGSVTEKVIRTATCPTLVVPPRAPDVAPDAPVRFRRVLCPVDFSESSLRAIAYAVNVAEQSDAKLRLLHVVEAPVVLNQEPSVTTPSLLAARAATGANARRHLHELVPERAQAYCTVDSVVAERRGYDEILRQVAELQADLVVMGVHGRGVVDRLLFGSTTHHVIRAAVCPVLIVRSDAGRAAAAWSEHRVETGVPG
jgi:nucleotide-binding universal stress UspA family protein